MKCAWDNEASGHKKVIFNIKWKKAGAHYYLNSGAYDYEEEILLMDGVTLKVAGVEDVIDNQVSYTLITLEN
jgi:hypothetical protein